LIDTADKVDKSIEDAMSWATLTGITK
jgi:hypothetical protein